MTRVCPGCGGRKARRAKLCRACHDAARRAAPKRCADCGNPIGRKATRCPVCASLYRRSPPRRCVECGTAVRGRTTTCCGACARGEKRPFAKLTPEEVVEIRALLDGGASQREVARRFGVSQPLVGRIAARKAWAHVE